MNTQMSGKNGAVPATLVSVEVSDESLLKEENDQV